MKSRVVFELPGVHAQNYRLLNSARATTPDLRQKLLRVYRRAVNDQAFATRTGDTSISEDFAMPTGTAVQATESPSTGPKVLLIAEGTTERSYVEALLRRFTAQRNFLADDFPRQLVDSAQHGFLLDISPGKSVDAVWPHASPDLSAGSPSGRCTAGVLGLLDAAADFETPPPPVVVNLNRLPGRGFEEWFWRSHDHFGLHLPEEFDLSISWQAKESRRAELLASALALQASLSPVLLEVLHVATPPRPTWDHEPLALACGLRRLSVPLVPRAPGRTGAAGRFGVGVHGLSLGLAA
ncbi:hypothetical protein AB0D10_00775 [Kitasatospora sp. NPDC048545]|uniref:hypothetical protein n=1 Tax=Kitasatospora sp. NPDC048545 TaxID=3157208 RepID=UPI0033C99BDC